MTAAWLFLIVAGLFEIGWPVGLKLSQKPELFWSGVVIAALCMTASGFFLWRAQHDIPIGTAYAVWTGIGAAGTFLVGVAFFGDTLTLMRSLSVLLIFMGVIGLKLSHS